MSKNAEKISNALLQLNCEIWGNAPVQALGTVAGREFYFRARHTEWTFEVATDDGDLPTDIGAEAVFFREGKHENASWMPLEEAVAIIKRNALEYVTASGRPTSDGH
jgi:hypothetical protein